MSNFTENRFELVGHFQLVLLTFDRDERRDVNYGWRDPDDIFRLFEPHLIPKTASRREGIDSDEDSDESKEGSESPVG